MGRKLIGNVRGLPGKSAYQIAVENGFQGTEAQWIAALAESASKLPLAGGTMRGPVQWVQDFQTLDHGYIVKITGSRGDLYLVQRLPNDTTTDVLVHGIATPEDDSDAVPKSYVDALIRRIEELEQTVEDLDRRLSHLET